MMNNNEGFNVGGQCKANGGFTESSQNNGAPNAKPPSPMLNLHHQMLNLHHQMLILEILIVEINVM